MSKNRPGPAHNGGFDLPLKDILLLCAGVSLFHHGRSEGQTEEQCGLRTNESRRVVVTDMLLSLSPPDLALALRGSRASFHLHFVFKKLQASSIRQASALWTASSPTVLRVGYHIYRCRCTSKSWLFSDAAMTQTTDSTASNIRGPGYK